MNEYRVPQPLDPLDRNACRNCYWPVVLLGQVGWVHDTRSGLYLECRDPTPAWPRCVACGVRLAADLTGAVVPHVGVNTPHCPGGGVLGIPPVDDAAATIGDWSASDPDVAR